MRRFHFDGDDTDYVVFLEDLVQRHGLLQPTRLSTSSTLRGDNGFQHSTPPPSDNEERVKPEKFQIIQYEPTKAKKGTRAQATKERWRSELDSLLSRFPSIDALESKAQGTGLGNNHIFVSSLVDGFALSEKVADAANDEAFDALGVLRRYALFTKKASDEARLVSCMAKFQDLFLCLFAMSSLG